MRCGRSGATRNGPAGQDAALARVAQAATEIRIARIVLSIIAAPFYVLGYLVAFIVCVVVWCVAAAQVGYTDGRKRKVT